MAPNLKRLSNEQIDEITRFCRRISASSRIRASCLCSDYIAGILENKTAVRVLLIIHDFAPRLMNYAKVLGDTSLLILAVDEWVFERDIDRGFLGEALASELIFPYVSLVNDQYLCLQEIRLKKRLMVEMLESLVLDFPELSYVFCIEPEYFMYEAMLTRARLYPPMMYVLASLTEKSTSKQKIDNILRGYMRALEELKQEGIVSTSNDLIQMSPDFVARARRREVRFINFFKTGQRALFASLLGIIPGILNFLSQNRDLLLSLQKMRRPNAKLDLQIEDPENHVYVPTSTGLAPLTSRMDIEEFARTVLGADRNTEISVKSLGGILNDVFMITAKLENKETKVVVKRFRDWSNFKWFPLTLWSVGTRTFTVFGRSRLEKECAMSQLLYSKGFCVPRLLHVSPPRRLIFMEYLEGESLAIRIKNIAKAKNKKELHEDLQILEKVGRFFADIHKLKIALGDTKPENILVRADCEICMMDFEQAERNGDRAWDIAEFIYYAGHYMPSSVDMSHVENMAEAFLNGYLKAGGEARIIRSAGKAKYTKVFSVFTLPNIMIALSNACKKVEKKERKQW